MEYVCLDDTSFQLKRQIVGYVHQQDTLPLYWFQFGARMTPVNERWQAPDVTVYPNPASHMLTVQAAVNIERLRVYDLAGREVIRVEQQQNINLASLSNGIYFLEIDTGRGRLLKKIIKR